MSAETAALELFNAAKSVANTITTSECVVNYLFSVFAEDAVHDDVATGTPSIIFRAALPLHAEAACAAPAAALIRNRKAFYQHPARSWRCELTVCVRDVEDSYQYTFHSDGPPHKAAEWTWQFRINDTTEQANRSTAEELNSWLVTLRCSPRTNVIRELDFTHNPREHPDLVKLLHAESERARMEFALQLLDGGDCKRRRRD